MINIVRYDALRVEEPSPKSVFAFASEIVSTGLNLTASRCDLVPWRRGVSREQRRAEIRCSRVDHC